MVGRAQGRSSISVQRFDIRMAASGRSPFATLGPPDLPSPPYLPKGAKGARHHWLRLPTSDETLAVTSVGL